MSASYLFNRRSIRSQATGSNGYYLRRHRPRAARTPLLEGSLSLETIADPENLLRVYRWLKATGGLAPGIDGFRFQKLSITEAAEALRQVSRAICNPDRRYRPYPARPVLIGKPNGGHRELRIGNIFDRVVTAAVQEALASRVDQTLLPCCYGYRPRRSVWDLLADLERIITLEGRYVITTEDVRNAFPSVPIADAIGDFREIVEDEGVRWLVETLLRGAAGLHRTIGIDQGSAISPAALNLRLNSCLDRPYSAGPNNPPMLRWADDLILPCIGVPEAQAATQIMARLLTAAGFELKGHNNLPIDLRDEGASRNVLGFDLSIRGDRLMLAVHEEAWRSLALKLDQAYETGNPQRTAMDVVGGWLQVYGAGFGGVGAEDNVGRVISEMVKTGFGEFVPRLKLGDVISMSQERWERTRRLVGGLVV